MKLKRKNIRLKNYDYSKEGYYYITICIKNRKEILSKIETYNTKLKSNDVGVGVLRATTNIEKIASNVVGVGVLDDPII